MKLTRKVLLPRRVESGSLDLPVLKEVDMWRNQAVLVAALIVGTLAATAGPAMAGEPGALNITDQGPAKADSTDVQAHGYPTLIDQRIKYQCPQGEEYWVLVTLGQGPHVSHKHYSGPARRTWSWSTRTSCTGKPQHLVAQVSNYGSTFFGPVQLGDATVTTELLEFDYGGGYASSSGKTTIIQRER